MIKALRPPFLTDCFGKFAINCEPEARVSNAEIRSDNWVGFGTYMVSGFIRGGCEIGRYCSIGRGVSIGMGHHDIAALSTSSWFPVLGGSSLPLAQETPKRRVVIGHDVWIGDNVKILNGVTVGTGAVLATSAVITKDVAPYEIVGGVPAKVIKKRWSEKLIKELMLSKWWEYDPHILRDIYDVDIETFLKKLKSIDKKTNALELKYTRLTQEDIRHTSEKKSVEKSVKLSEISSFLMSKYSYKSDIRADGTLSSKYLPKPLKLKPDHDYRIDISFVKPIPAEGYIWEIRGPKDVIQSRALSKNDTEKFVFFHMPSKELNAQVIFKDAKGKELDVALKDVALTEIDFFDRKPKFKFTENSLVACIASYPLRQDMLKLTIESLIDQVDQVLVYLNGYQFIPEFILKWAAEEKLRYVVSSENELRAAGKFHWFGQSGYFLLCDDDIIFPKDYGVKMRAHIESMKRSGVVGLMPTTYKNNEDGRLIRKSYTAFNKSSKKRTLAHQLGTGVMAFHSDTVKNMNRERLLSEPIYNDEIFAIEARRCGVPLWNIERHENWIKANPAMKYGIREEVAIHPYKRKHKSNILNSLPRWPDLYIQPVKKYISDEVVLQRFESAIKNLVKTSKKPLSIVRMGTTGLREKWIQNLNLRTIFFEPIRHRFKDLQKDLQQQKNCIFINIAITDKTGSSNIRYVNPKAVENAVLPDWAVGLSSLRKGVNAIDGVGVNLDAKSKDIIKKNVMTEEIQTLSFESFTKWENFGDAEIFIIDTEGYDAYILSQIARGISRPKIILAKTNRVSLDQLNKLRETLVRCGYMVSCGEKYSFFWSGD